MLYAVSLLPFPPLFRSSLFTLHFPLPAPSFFTFHFSLSSPLSPSSPCFTRLGSHHFCPAFRLLALFHRLLFSLLFSLLSSALGSPLLLRGTRFSRFFRKTSHFLSAPCEKAGGRPLLCMQQTKKHADRHTPCPTGTPGGSFAARRRPWGLTGHGKSAILMEKQGKTDQAGIGSRIRCRGARGIPKRIPVPLWVKDALLRIKVRKGTRFFERASSRAREKLCRGFDSHPFPVVFTAERSPSG